MLLSRVLAVVPAQPAGIVQARSVARSVAGGPVRRPHAGEASTALKGKVKVSSAARSVVDGSELRVVSRPDST